MGHAQAFRLVTILLFIRVSDVSCLTTDTATTSQPTSVSDTSIFSNNNEHTSQETMETGTDVTTQTNNNVTISITVNASTTESPSNQTVKMLTYRDYPEYKVYKFLDNTYVYFASWPGIPGNLLTFIAAFRLKPYTPTTVCMLVLAAADFVACTIRLVYFYSEVVNVYTCKFLNYALTFVYIFSNLTLVVWTVERLIAVAFPMKLQLWCTVRNTLIALSVSFIFANAISVPYAVEVGFEIIYLTETISNGRCIFPEYILEIYFHVETVFYIWIPFLIILVSNMIIIYLLSKRGKARASMTTNSESNKKRNAEQKRTTYVLVAVSFAFILFHIPYSVKIIYDEYFWLDPLRDGHHYFVKYLVLGYILLIWVHLQNCVNFIIYCLTGPRFRREFVNVFCFCLRSPRKAGRGDRSEGTAITSVSKTVGSV